MTAPVKLSRRDAEALDRALAILRSHAGVGLSTQQERAHDALREALATKPKRPGPQARKTAAKKRSKAAETRAIWDAAYDRSRGFCEACGTGRVALELDHFFGRGAGRPTQSVETCWLLCVLCHRAKTDSVPSRQDWLGDFRDHANHYGYVKAALLAEKRLDSLRLSDEAASVGRAAR